MMEGMRWLELTCDAPKRVEVLLSDDETALHAWIIWRDSSAWRQVYLPPKETKERVDLLSQGRLLGIFRPSRARHAAEVALEHLISLRL